MSNSIELQKVLAPAAAGLEVNFWMKEMARVDHSSKFTDESGETIKFKVHNTPTVVQTADLTGSLSSMETKSVDLSILPYKTGFSYSDLENTFELADKEIFLENAGKAIADQLIDKAYATMLNRSTQGVVVSTAGAAKWKNLSDAKIAIGNSKMEGRINGVLSSELRGIIMDSSTSNNAFGTSELASKYASGNIGTWNGVKWADYSIPVTTIEDVFPAGTVTITNTAGIYGGTVSHFTPTSSVGTALSIKAGTMFEVAGVYTVNRFGSAQATKRKFIVQSDVTIPTGTGGADIDVGEVFFSSGWKNVSVSAISALAVTNSVAAGKSYYTGVAFKDTELLMAMPEIKPMKGIPSTSVKSVEGLPIRLSYNANAVTSQETAVLQTMFGVNAYLGLGVYAIYQLVE